jgi:uncharacterized protein (DUF1778 family)
MPVSKEKRLQVRVTDEQLAFLRTYAEVHDLSISQMVRDFIEWLKKREAQSGTQASA